MAGTDPIHQFHLQKWIPLELGGYDVSFTNSSAFMVATVVAAAGLLYFSTAGRSLIPGRMQSVSEMAYEFVANTLRDSAGTSGMKFFPFVFSLFMFVLVANLFGMFPYFFTVTSHLIVTFAPSTIVASNAFSINFSFWPVYSGLCTRRSGRTSAG